MPLNHYVTLGRSGLRVSPMCLGAMTFGQEWGWGSTPEDSAQILNAYIARGGNFIDTANAYTKGHSEKIIGDVVGKDASKRDRLVIATKFYTNLYPGDPNGGGTNRKSILAACEQSLRRLQTDYIDLYWMHAWDSNTPIDETMSALEDLTRAGKIRYAGFSDTPAWKVTEAQMTARFRGWNPLVALQIEYSLLERTVEGDLIPMALEMGLGVTPWSPLKSGVLTGKFKRGAENKAGRGEWVENALNDKAFTLIESMEGVAKELNTSVSRVALAWLLAKPGVSSIIIGARTMQQLEDNVGAADVNLTPEMVTKLDQLSEPTLNFPAKFLEFVVQASSGGLTINGKSHEPWPLAPKTDAERF